MGGNSFSIVKPHRVNFCVAFRKYLAEFHKRNDWAGSQEQQG